MAEAAGDGGGAMPTVARVVEGVGGDLVRYGSIARRSSMPSRSRRCRGASRFLHSPKGAEPLGRLSARSGSGRRLRWPGRG